MLAHANILASTTTLYTLIPLSLTFTKKKGEPPQLNPNTNMFYVVT